MWRKYARIVLAAGIPVFFLGAMLASYIADPSRGGGAVVGPVATGFAVAFIIDIVVLLFFGSFLGFEGGGD